MARVSSVIELIFKDFYLEPSSASIVDAGFLLSRDLTREKASGHPVAVGPVIGLTPG